MYLEGYWASAAWSPCSRVIAVARPTTVDIRDAATLELLNTFDSADFSCAGLGFSPDGRTLTKLHKFGLTSWDLQTGIPIGTAPLAEAEGRNGEQGSSLITIYDIFSGTHTCSYRALGGDSW